MKEEGLTVYGVQVTLKKFARLAEPGDSMKIIAERNGNFTVYLDRKKSVDYQRRDYPSARRSGGRNDRDW